MPKPAMEQLEQAIRNLGLPYRERIIGRGHTVTENDNGTVTVSGPDIFTDKPYSVIVSQEQFNKWNSGTSIQDAMPEVSAGDREFLISGISPEGFETFIAPLPPARSRYARELRGTTQPLAVILEGAAKVIKEDEI